ncbi:hypothetical protein DFH11DRAFT_1745722 [Phellopilus nigrolimitatus]|nr:hypothetical protein DFH11DRAFT_1745722 [Phellopilus nigrolimitatus]
MDRAPPRRRAADLAHTHGSLLITLDAYPVLAFHAPPRDDALAPSVVGVPSASANLTPANPVLELFFPASEKTIYVIWATMHTQEIISVVVAPSLPNAADLAGSLLRSGSQARALPLRLPLKRNQKRKRVARALPRPSDLLAGCRHGSRVGRRARVLRHASDYASSPHDTQRPLRPPKPPGGALYARYSPEQRLGQEGQLGKQMEYVRGVVDDPHVLPLIMGWDVARMGYVELVCIKENHVAPYVPADTQDYDRGLHVLVGEDKFRMQAYPQTWFRSVTHYIFLAETRRRRSEARECRDRPHVRTSVDAGMHLKTSFYFPYKHSMMTMNLRERLFKEDVFH